jgi:hypothetical protein
MSTALGQQTSLFRPTQISGCSLWLDGTDINGNGTKLTNATSISTWVDKSGNGRNVSQATSTNQPTFSSNGVLFDGVNDFLLTSVPLSSLITDSNYTVFISATNFSISGGGPSYTGPMFICDENAWFGIFISSAAIGAYNWDNNADYASVPFTSPGTAIVTTQHTNNILSASLFGNTPVTTASGNTGNLTYTLALGRSYGGQYYTQCLINELLIFNVALNTSQRQQIEGYLAWKWGLQANLPSTHPYRLAPLYQLPPFPLVPAVQRGTNSIVYRPTSISNLVLWLDAAQDTSNHNSFINSVPDRSASAYTISAVSNNTITIVRNGLNGRAYYNFGNNRMKVSSFVWRTKFTCFFVVKANIGNFLYSQWANSTYTQYVFAGNWRLLYVNSAFEVNDSVIAQGTSVTGTSWCILTIGYNNGSSASPYNVNGTARTTQLVSAPSTTGQPDTNITADIFLNGNGTTTFDTTEVAEILHFNNNLSSTQVSQIEGYLAWKWGLQGVLPSSHPYKNSPLYQIPPFPSIPAIVRGTSKSFRPTNITGCQLWLDAADATTIIRTGSSVTQWNDKSGNGRNLTGFNGPTYSSQRVNLVPNAYLQVGSFPSGTYTLFIVANITSGNGPLYGSTTSTGYTGFFPNYAGNYYLVESDSRWNGSTTAGDVTTSSASITFNNGTQYIYSIIYNFSSSTALVWANGSISSVINGIISGTITIDSLILGRRSGDYMTGYFNEVIHLNSALSSSQRQGVEGYLAWKWGLQSTLPQTHPFKLFPPPPN